MSEPITQQFPEITSVIPHRRTMVLLNRILASSPDMLRAEVVIDQDNIFFDVATNSVGAWLGIEFMAQAIAAHEGAQALQRSEQVKVGFLLGSRRYESHCARFFAGTVLQVEAHLVLEHENGLGAFDCKITDANQQLLASATVTVFKPDNAHQFLKRIESSAV